MISEAQKHSWTIEAREHVKACQRPQLAFGEFLCKVRLELTGIPWDEQGSGRKLREWNEWLKTIPLDEHTATSYIRRYRIARRSLPPEVFEAAKESGINICSKDAKRPYGKYTDAVREVGVPSTAADLHEVQQAYDASRRAPKKLNFDYDKCVERAIETVMRCSDFIPAGHSKKKFAADVLEGVMQRLGMYKQKEGGTAA